MCKRVVIVICSLFLLVGCLDVNVVEEDSSDNTDSTLEGRELQVGDNWTYKVTQVDDVDTGVGMAQYKYEDIKQIVITDIVESGTTKNVFYSINVLRDKYDWDTTLNKWILKYANLTFLEHKEFEMNKNQKYLVNVIKEEFADSLCFPLTFPFVDCDSSILEDTVYEDNFEDVYNSWFTIKVKDYDPEVGTLKPSFADNIQDKELVSRLTRFNIHAKKNWARFYIHSELNVAPGIGVLNGYYKSMRFYMWDGDVTDVYVQLLSFNDLVLCEEKE